MQVFPGSLRIRTAVPLICLPIVLCSCATIHTEYNVKRNAAAGRAERFAAKGDYGRAIDQYRDSLREYEQSGNELGILMALERKAWLCRESGRYGEAMEDLGKARELGQKLNGDADEIDADIGDVYLFSGDHNRAADSYRKAVSALSNFVFKTSFSRPPSDDEISRMVRMSKALTHARINLATMHYLRGEYDMALEQIAPAAALFDRIDTVINHPLYRLFIKIPPDLMDGKGYCHTINAAALGAKGEYDKAWKAFDAGRAAFGKSGKPYNILVNESLRLRCEFTAAGQKNDPRLLEKADAFITKAGQHGAVEIVWRVSYEVGRTLRTAGLTAQARAYLDHAIGALEQTRGQIREDTMKQTFSASIQDVYGEAVSLCYDAKDYTAGFDYLEKAKARAFLDMLAGRQIPRDRNVDPLLAARAAEIQENVDRVQRALRTSDESGRQDFQKEYSSLLKERADVLEKIKAQSLKYASSISGITASHEQIAAAMPGGSVLVSYFIDRNRVLIWILRDGAISAVHAPVKARELSELVGDYRDAIPSRQEDFRKTIGAQLSIHLIRPIEPYLVDAKCLVVAPSGILYHTPFACLTTSDGRYLVEKTATAVLPSASSALLVKKQDDFPGGGLFALGNPQRDAGDVPLPFAEAEVKGLAVQFTAKTVLTGKEATESSFKTADLKTPAVIHIAAHGKYNPAMPLSSALLMARDAANDGLLEAFEIYSLDMTPRLVVLSACQSGIGKVTGGDEIQSLGRAFMYAGAGGVVSSLWSVSDQSSAELMTTFYEGLRGTTAAEALRQAQMKTMRKYPAPCFWAAFYLTGGPSL